MGPVDESEQVDEESLAEQENIGKSLESDSLDIKEKHSEDSEREPSSDVSEEEESPNQRLGSSSHPSSELVSSESSPQQVQ